MNRNELDLMRLLHGELPEERARELRARLERDPALREEHRRLERSWEGLALPPAAPVPPGFAQRIAVRARAERTTSGLSWSAAPGWVRATAAAALVLGTALGVGVGGSWPLREQLAEVQAVQEDEDLSEIEGSLTESYWSALEGLE